MLYLNCKFGRIGIDELNVTKDDTHINLYDSNENYLDYVDAETLQYLADEHGTTIEEEYADFCEKVRSFETVSELLDYLSYSWDCISKDIRDIVKAMANRYVYETAETVLDNEWVNQIGDTYILLTEC